VIYLIPKTNFRLAKGANAFGDVWEFTQEMKNQHPAPFPIALINRIISSTTSNIILDPFNGSGTTSYVAKELMRHYIGIDISPEYCKMAERRIDKYIVADDYPTTERNLFTLDEPKDEYLHKRRTNKKA
jgi:modification methylase